AVIDADQHVLTNAHVVDASTSTSITPISGDKAPARLLGSDSVLDLALLGVESVRRLSALPLGDSATLRVGDEVVAITNPAGFGLMLTSGIVSAVNRVVPSIPDQRLIQTDV